MALSGWVNAPGPSKSESLVYVSGAYQPGEVHNRGNIRGNIRGKVRFSGNIAERRHIEVKKDMEFCGEEMISEELILGEEGGVMNAVVSLEGIQTGKVPKQSAILKNKACAFVPHVLAVTRGATLEIRSNDPVLHTAHLYLGNRTLFNLALPRARKGMKLERKLEETGLIRVLCDVHGWMKAYILVVDHPYFALTDEKGSFEIRDIPPGSYPLKVWHELLGVQFKEASVSEGKDTLVEFTFEGEEGPSHEKE
jgi:plastocyanin